MSLPLTSGWAVATVSLVDGVCFITSPFEAYGMQTCRQGSCAGDRVRAVAVAVAVGAGSTYHHRGTDCPKAGLTEERLCGH